jgi:hypothetical protein
MTDLYFRRETWGLPPAWTVPRNSATFLLHAREKNLREIRHLLDRTQPPVGCANHVNGLAGHIRATAHAVLAPCLQWQAGPNRAARLKAEGLRGMRRRGRRLERAKRLGYHAGRFGVLLIALGRFRRRDKAFAFPHLDGMSIGPWRACSEAKPSSSLSNSRMASMR